MTNLIDVFVNIDDNPHVLKRPLLPFTYNSYRIPLYVNYNKQIESWPVEPYYHTFNFNVVSILINGSRFPKDTSNGNVPRTNSCKIHSTQDGVFICVAFDIDTMWMWERIDVIVTDKATYSLYGTKELNGDSNPPMIAKNGIRTIEKKADPLKYARFSFDTLNLLLIWNNQRITLYGGEMVIFIRYYYNEIIKEFPIGRYIINKISYNKINANLEGIDFRYVLNKKFPIKTFNKNDYPYIEDEYIDVIIPECIVIGNGIPGICLQGKQIYTTFPQKLPRYEFRFPPGWKELYKIEVKTSGFVTVDGLVTQNPVDTWIEVYPGYGNPNMKPNIGELIRFPEYNPVSPHIASSHINSSAGIVTIPYSLALANGEYGGSINEVRMYGLWPNGKMKQEGNEPGAIKFLMDASKDLTISENLTGEWDGLAEIGLYMDESKSIFEWIEIIQSGNIIGGQLMLINDTFKYKIENPNRGKKFDIPKADVLNHAGMKITVASELWFSGWNIEYIKAIAGDEKGTLIGNTGLYPTAEIYNGNDLTSKFIRNNLRPSQDFFDTTFIQQKINIIRDTITIPRHKINMLFLPITKDYLELQIYDVIGYLPETLEDIVQNVDWIIYDKELDIQEQTISLKIIERKKTVFWRHDPFIITFDKNNDNAQNAAPGFMTVLYPDTTLPELPIPPALAQYTFTGWNTDSEGNGEWITTTSIINRDIVAYAIWKNNHS